MADIKKAKPKLYKPRVKKHGKKKFVRPSQKKSVKNGRHQEKEAPKQKVAKAVAAIPEGLDGKIIDDDLPFGYLPEEGDAEVEEELLDDELVFDDEDVNYPDKEY